jgi:FixJ family two-component response regulator
MSFNVELVGSTPRPALARRPTVFIVDNDASVRESLKRVSRREGWDVEAFSSAQEFLSQATVDGPGCLVVDLGPHGQSGLMLQHQMAQADSCVPIIFITSAGDVAMTVRAMKAGAADVLPRPVADEDLWSAMRGAFQSSEAALRHEASRRTLRSRYDSLTPREQQVMGLVISGLLNKQVGGELGISEITVKAHRGQVMRKMGAESLPDLVRMAVRLSLPLAATH